MTGLLAGVLSPEFPVIALIAFAGGLMRGFSGFGSALVMAPLFALVLGPVPAVLLTLSLDLVATLTLASGALRLTPWPTVAPIALAGFATIPLGGYLLVVVDAEVMRRVIAIMLVVAALIMLSGWRYRGRRGTGPGIAVGRLSGLINGATGMGGPRAVL